MFMRNRIIDFRDVDGVRYALDGECIHMIKIIKTTLFKQSVVRLIVYWDADIKETDDSAIYEFRVEYNIAEKIFKNWSDFMNSTE